MLNGTRTNGNMESPIKEGLKKCFSRAHYKPLAEFIGPKGTPRLKCIACTLRQQSLNFSYKKTVRHKEMVRRSIYHIGLAEQKQLYAFQDGKCAVCSIDIEYVGANTCLDHCHETNVVRGFLCSRCNVIEGMCNKLPAIAPPLSIVSYIADPPYARMIEQSCMLKKVG